MQLCDSLFAFFLLCGRLSDITLFISVVPNLNLDGYYARREKSLIRAMLINLYLDLLARTRVHAP